MKVFPSASKAYFESLKITIEINPLILNYSIKRERLSETAGFIQIQAKVIKEFYFSIFEYYKEDSGVIAYRYHLMDKDKKLVVRWDNAPHYPELEPFPHHYHTKEGVFSSNQPTIQQVLNLLQDYLG